MDRKSGTIPDVKFSLLKRPDGHYLPNFITNLSSISNYMMKDKSGVDVAGNEFVKFVLKKI